MSDHHPTPKDYMYVFLALLALLVLTCGLSFIDFDSMLPGQFWSTSIALLVAIAKALLIMLYFMHVKTGPKRAWVFAGAGFLWLGILVTLSFSDYLTRNHPPGESPKGEPRYLIQQ